MLPQGQPGHGTGNGGKDQVQRAAVDRRSEVALVGVAASLVQKHVVEALQLLSGKVLARRHAVAFVEESAFVFVHSFLEKISRGENGFESQYLGLAYCTEGEVQREIFVGMEIENSLSAHDCKSPGP